MSSTVIDHFVAKQNYCLTEDNSFDKDIPDADSKKIIQHHFKLKKKTCMENA